MRFVRKRKGPRRPRPDFRAVLLARSVWGFAIFSAAAAAAIGIAFPPVPQGVSQWVYPGPNGKLVYKTTPAGDRIMDFSHAGYMGGGVALPTVQVKKTVEPSGGDDTARIQAAIDAVAALPLKNGFRGAVLLAPGVFACSGTITISPSGVVLRGSASKGDKRSTIKLTGKPHNGITVAGKARRQEAVRGSKDQDRRRLRSVRVRRASPWPTRKGSRRATRSASARPSRRNGSSSCGWTTWSATARSRPGWRRAASSAPSGRSRPSTATRITLDVPLSDSFDAKFAGPKGTAVVKIRPTWLTQVGVEHLHIECPPQAIPHTQPHFTALRITGQDCWVRDVVCDETMDSVGVHGRRITLQQVFVNRKARHQGASRPGEIEPGATQTLMDRCGVTADNVWFAWTGSGIAGPLVLLNCTFLGDSRAESHQRWATGMLYDSCRAPDGSFEFRNRGSMGSGHGWSMGWGVAWNCVGQGVHHPEPARRRQLADRLRRHEPAQPASVRQGAAESAGGHPRFARRPGRDRTSLYLAQLAERLGPQALENIGR